MHSPGRGLLLAQSYTLLGLTELAGTEQIQQKCLVSSDTEIALCIRVPVGRHRIHTSSNGSGMVILGTLCALLAYSQLRKVLRNRETPNAGLERWFLRSIRQANLQGGVQVELTEIIPRRQRSFRMLWVNSEARRVSLSRAGVTEALCPRYFCQARSCDSPGSSPVASPASWRTGTAGHRGKRLPSPPSCCPRCTTRPSAAPAPRRACGTPGSPHRDRPDCPRLAAPRDPPQRPQRPHRPPGGAAGSNRLPRRGRLPARNSPCAASVERPRCGAAAAQPPA